MELQLENKYLNDSYNYSIWDGVLWNAAKQTENLTLYMNTSMTAVHSDGAHISSVECYQMTTELRLELTAGVFVDATGNGTLGYEAGAEYKIGREGRDEYQEQYAPAVPDGKTMGNTIYFVARGPRPSRQIRQARLGLFLRRIRLQAPLSRRYRGLS